MIGQALSHYRIIEKIGAGGMGQVFKARDERLDRDVAIKVLREELAVNPDRLRRFEQEARSASALNHPNIITIFDVGKHGDTPYIAMEYVEGQTLRDVLVGGPLPTTKLIELASQIAEGLAKAHAAGITHRDLKPENVMVTTDGYVKILDFGLAKLRPSSESDSEAVTATREGTIMGTVGYMSPEQAKGQSVDHRSDQFSFGAILYEMITGKRAFQRETPVQTLSAIIEQEHDSIAAIQPGTSTHLRAIVDRCLAKNPEARYDSTRDLAKELGTLEDKGRPVEPRRAWPRLLLVAGGITVLILLALVLNFTGLRDGLVGTTPAPRIESLAVLPLENLSGDPEQEYFADGMTEALIAELGQLGTIRVISRTSVMMYKDERKPLPEIARELNVDAVIEGSVLRSGDRVRITAQLLRVEPEEHLWAHNYERDYGEVLTLQSEIALAVAREIESTLSPQTEARLARSRTVNPEAYEAYLKGRYFLNQRTQEGLKRSRGHFRQAIDNDPTYAPAYAGLSDYYDLMAAYGGIPPSEGLPRAEAAAKRALELDESSGEAHTSLGNIFWTSYFDWHRAEREFKRAIELNPNYATAHMWYGGSLASLGRIDDAIREIDQAVDLDPLSPLPAMAAGAYLFMVREYEQSSSFLEMVLGLNPDYPMARWFLGLSYAQKGSFPEAVAELQDAVRGGVGTNVLGDLGRVYGLMGRTREARAVLDQLTALSEESYVSPFDIALVYTGLGEVNQAVEWLEKAWEQRIWYLAFLRTDPRLDPLRSHPGFQDLIRDMNFPE